MGVGTMRKFVRMLRLIPKGTNVELDPNLSGSGFILLQFFKCAALQGVQLSSKSVVPVCFKCCDHVSDVEWFAALDFPFVVFQIRCVFLESRFNLTSWHPQMTVARKKKAFDLLKIAEIARSSSH